jgi:benzoate-CoA ligase family protein
VTVRAADLPLAYNAVELLRGNLAARAGKTALLSAERTATYAEVAAEAGRTANALRRAGLARGDVVAILLPDSVEWVATFFGALQAGGVAFGMNTMLKPAEHRFQLADGRARFLVAHAALLAPLREALAGLGALERVLVVGGPAQGSELERDAWLARESPQAEVAPTRRDDPCTLSYSSGTTGEPKGILHAHKDLPLCAELWAVNVLGLRAEDRTFAAAKLFFTYGTGGNLVFPFHVGASAVLLAGPARVVKNVLDTIERFRPTILYNSPTGYAQALAHEGFAGRDLASLRLCVSAGEALPAPIWHAWKERTGLDVLDGIGSTENWHIFVSNRPGDIRPGSSGKPVPGYEVKLVDEEGRELVTPEATGHLWVRGETAARAYLGREEASRRTFRDGWLVTGDEYRRDADGYYWHVGRSDDLLKVGGIFVSPVEVESTLLAHAAVLECAVVGERDTAGLVKPTAFIVPQPGVVPSPALAEELVAHCRARIADYKRPRRIEFLDELPKTATGKIQRFRLRG